MFRLLIVAFLFVSVNCFANDYIRVTGQGSTLTEAKNNAFREAVQLKIGTVVLSEQESTINSLDKNNISVYSAGYVYDYKIVSSFTVGQTTTIVMDVLVNPSKLLNQKLSTGKVENYVDGYKLHDKIVSYRSQKQDAYQIIDIVMQSYPQNAFTIKTQPFSVVVDKYQNTILQIPYKLVWNYDYIEAFNEAMQITQDNKFGLFERAPANVTVMAKNPKDYVIGKHNHYEFNDIPMIEKVKSSMAGEREVRIKLTLRDGNNSKLYSSCWIPNSLTGKKNNFYYIGEPNNIVVYGNESEENTLHATIDRQHEWILQKTITIDVSVVPNSSC